MLETLILAALAWITGVGVISALIGGKKDFPRVFVTLHAFILGMALIGTAFILILVLIVAAAT